MRQACLRLMLLSALSAFIMQPVFADDSMMSESKPCMAIAKACMDAGYTRNGNGDKRFWFDCMKPVILGKTVKDVNIDADTVKSCRRDKIAQLRKDLKDFENAHSASE